MILREERMEKYLREISLENLETLQEIYLQEWPKHIVIWSTFHLLRQRLEQFPKLKEKLKLFSLSPNWQIDGEFLMTVSATHVTREPSWLNLISLVWLQQGGKFCLLRLTQRFSKRCSDKRFIVVRLFQVDNFLLDKKRVPSAELKYLRRTESCFAWRHKHCLPSSAQDWGRTVWCHVSRADKQQRQEIVEVCSSPGCHQISYLHLWRYQMSLRSTQHGHIVTKDLTSSYLTR